MTVVRWKEIERWGTRYGGAKEVPINASSPM